LLAVILILFFLPETLRSIAGNGTIRLRGLYVPLIWRFTKYPSYLLEPKEALIKPRVTGRSFIEPLKLLLEKDVLSNLVFGGVVYAIWIMVTSSATGLLKDKFNLHEILIGLSFLPNGKFAHTSLTNLPIDNNCDKVLEL
jgi:hypothetical protein